MDHAYQHLVLVAEPRFLGQLREALDEQVSRHVVATVDKDYAQLDERDLLDRLAPHLPGAQSPA